MKKISTLNIAIAYKLLNNGTLAKIERGKDRYAVIKILRVFKPIAEFYEESRIDALKKLREGHEEKCTLLERIGRHDTSLTQEEVEKGNQFASELAADLNSCLQDIADKENEVEFEPLTEDVFAGLLEGNDWHTADCMFLEEVLT